jgi:hypothetical protein
MLNEMGPGGKFNGKRETQNDKRKTKKGEGKREKRKEEGGLSEVTELT